MSKKIMKMLSAILALSCAAVPMEISVSADNASETIVYGDATCNGEVDIRDITAVNQHIVKLNTLSEQGIKNCDFFGSGDVTVKDMGQMKKHIIGLVRTLEPITESDYIPKASIVYTGWQTENYGAKVYESAEELRKDISAEYLELEGSDEEFFSKNVLYVHNVYVHPSAKVNVKSVEKDADGNFIANVVQKFDNLLTTDVVINGFSVCMAVPKSEYSGQSLEINMSSVCDKSAFEISEENVFITPVDTTCIDNYDVTEGRFITTYQEMQDYINSLYSEISCDCLPNWYEQFRKYDEEYFTDNVLYVKYHLFGTNGYDLKLNSVETDEKGNITVKIDNIYPYPEAGCVMTGCFTGVEIPKLQYTEQKISFEINDVYWSKIDYNFKISDYGMNAGDESAVCTTYEQFCDFVNEHYHPWPEMESETLSMYDEKFFEDNVLFISGYSKDFGIMKPVFDGITVTEDKVTLHMIRDYSEIDADDMNGCFVSFSMLKEVYKGQEFAVESKNINQESGTDYHFNACDYSSVEAKNIKPAICTSYEELVKYVEAYEMAEPNTSGDDKAYQILNKDLYNEEFFKDNVLCIGALNVTRGKNEIGFASVDYVCDSIILYYDRDDSRKEDNTYKSCFVAIGVSRDAYNGQDFRIGFAGEQNPEPEKAAAYAFVTGADYCYVGDKMALKPTVITSYEQLLTYTQNIFLTSHYGNEDVDIDIDPDYIPFEWVKEYDKKFFENNVLFLQRLEFGSDACVNIQPLERDDEKVTVYADVKCGMCDVMTGCFVGVAMSLSEYKGQDFEVVVRDIESFSVKKCFVTDMDSYPFSIPESNLQPQVFTTYSDFKKYADSFVVRVYVPEGDGFIDHWVSPTEKLTEKYDEKYFEDNVLLIQRVMVEENTEFLLQSVDKSEDSVIIYYQKAEIPTDSDVKTGFTGCFIGCEMSASEYTGQTLELRDAWLDYAKN